MRPLQIPTQIIFDNLIQPNQELGSDPVLNQSATVSTAQRLVSSVQSPASNSCVMSPGNLCTQKPLRQKKTCDLKILSRVSFIKKYFATFISTPKHILQAPNEKIIELAKNLFIICLKSKTLQKPLLKSEA